MLYGKIRLYQKGRCFNLKEKIYTIPVNEAFETDCECPLCELRKKVNREVVDFVLGPSYMEEDIRYETDKAGFCPKHYSEIFHESNRLGVALMVSTHLKKINKDLKTHLDAPIKSGKGLFKKASDIPPAVQYIKSVSETCFACKRVNERMEHYLDTVFYLFKTDPDFKEKIKNSKGFCLEHFSELISIGEKKLGKSAYESFMQTIIPIQKENLKRLDEELDLFIKKFDYRFKDEPWGNSKDSLERTILKLSSEYMDL